MCPIPAKGQGHLEPRGIPTKQAVSQQHPDWGPAKHVHLAAVAALEQKALPQAASRAQRLQ